MAWAFQSAGTAVQVYNQPLQPPLPPTYNVGDYLFLQAQTHMGSYTNPTISGYTLLTPETNAPQIALWTRIADGTETTLSFTYGTDYATAFMFAYTGGPSSLTGLVHAVIDYKSSNVNDINFRPLTITQANCLVLCGGNANKTSSTNGSTYNTLSGFNLRRQITVNNTGIMSVVNEQIQTTATSLTSVVQYRSVAESAAQSYETYCIALIPYTPPPGMTLTAAGGSFALSGQNAIFTPGYVSNTLVAMPGAFDFVGSGEQSDYQIEATPGQIQLLGEPAPLLFGGQAIAPSDPMPFDEGGHWKHLRKKELAKLQRIERALKIKRGEIKEPEEIEEEEPELETVDAPRNASGLDESYIDLSKMIKAMPKPKQSTGKSRALLDYEDEMNKIISSLYRKKH